MPFKSEAQRRWMYAAEARKEVPPGTAERWEHHTPAKKLPPRAGEKPKPTVDKKAFVEAFLTKCAADGLTTPAAITAAAEQFAAECLAAVKRASVGSVAEGIGDLGGRALGTWATTGAIGSILAPAALGVGVGTAGAQMRNKIDQDDDEALRIAAVAAAYRRRAAEAKTQDQVRKLIANDPSRYVVLG